MKKLSKLVLLFVLGLHILVLTGCDSLYPPIRKAWVQVDSPPTRTIVVCNEDVVTPEMVNSIIRQTQAKNYKDYKFNENTNMSVSATGDREVTASSTSSVSLNK